MSPLPQLEAPWSQGPNCILTVLNCESSKIQLQNGVECLPLPRRWSRKAKGFPGSRSLPQSPKWHDPWKPKTKIQPSVDKCPMVAQRWFYKQNLHDLGVETLGFAAQLSHLRTIQTALAFSDTVFPLLKWKYYLCLIPRVFKWKFLMQVCWETKQWMDNLQMVPHWLSSHTRPLLSAHFPAPPPSDC